MPKANLQKTMAVFSVILPIKMVPFSVSFHFFLRFFVPRVFYKAFLRLF